MASRIRGITVEIGGDTTGAGKARKSIDIRRLPTSRVPILHTEKIYSKKPLRKSVGIKTKRG